MYRSPGLLTAGLVLLLLISCAGPSDPVSPQLANGLSGPDPIGTGIQSLGIWDVTIDPVNGTIDAVPLRSASFSCNINTFIDFPTSHLLFSLENVDHQSDYTDISIDIGILHPFPGQNEFTGFDVVGVFMGNGSDVYPGPAGFAVSGAGDQQMLNPDGFTRWFNEPEFNMVPGLLFGYHPGELGTPGYTPTALLNPYRYFADDLDADENAVDFLKVNSVNRGCFTPGSTVHRLYELRFPSGTGLTFQYAVVAHWMRNTNAPDPPESLNDFPWGANADESMVVDIEDSSDLFYAGPADFGGNVVLDISVWDWSAECIDVMEEYAIYCYSDAWTGDGAVSMTPIAHSEHCYTFKIDVPVEVLTSNEPLPVWIEICYPDLDYTNKFGYENNATGALAGYFIVDVPVPIEQPKIGWARTWGGSGDDYGIEVTGDADGNIYITGHYDGEVDFDPGPGEDIHNSDNGEEAFLSKLNSSGEFQWARTWGSMDGMETCEAVAVDMNGDVYVSGGFYGTVDFDPGTGTSEYVSIGEQDGFVTKFDSDGTHLWTRTWGGSLFDTGYSVNVDGSGNVHIAGSFEDTADLDPGTATDQHISSGLEDAYIIKLMPDGSFLWAVSWGGVGDDRAKGIACTFSGMTFTIGEFSNTVDFDPAGGIQNQASNGMTDIFLTSLNSSGEWFWTNTWGGTSVDIGNHVRLVPSGFVYVTGSFQGTDVDFGGGDLHSSVGSEDVYLSKFDTSGAFQWAQTFGGTNLDCGNGLGVTQTDHIYVSGRFRLSVDFDPTSGTDIHDSHGACDIFLTQFDGTGAFQWAQTFGGTSSDRGYGGGVDIDGNALVTGRIGGAANLAPVESPCNEPSDMHTPVGLFDVFVLKITPEGCW